MVCVIWNGFLVGMGWVSTRLFMDALLLNTAVISCLERATLGGQAARSTLLYCQEEGTYCVRTVSSRLYWALGRSCCWTCPAVHYVKRDGLGLASELRSCVNREVGLGSHSLSHSSPVPNKPYGFCERKTLWTTALWTKALWTEALWTKAMWTEALWTKALWTKGLKHCGLKD